jgi:hypothetical protein
MLSHLALASGRQLPGKSGGCQGKDKVERNFYKKEGLRIKMKVGWEINLSKLSFPGILFL